MRRTRLLLAGLGLAMLIPASLASAAEKPVQICLGEGNEWAPFT
ncbi:hypothetical protein [Aeromonas jandaei]|nr:hypothetical protein [Aeromonas jandaei]